MTSRQISSPSDEQRAAAGHAQATLPVIELSFDVEPVVSIVRRHVKLSKAADAAITSELIEMLGRTTVLLRTTDHKAAVRESDEILTTEQAARLANVSRPYMVKLIDTGTVPLYQKVGNQRRVLRSAVMQWQENERQRQAKALRRLSKELDEEILSS